MNDKEVALRLTELRGLETRGETYLKVYLNTLEIIRNSKSETIIGKLEELFYKYDHKSSYCEMDKNIFIDDVREILIESKGE